MRELRLWNVSKEAGTQSIGLDPSHRIRKLLARTAYTASKRFRKLIKFTLNAMSAWGILVISRIVPSEAERTAGVARERDN